MEAVTAQETRELVPQLAQARAKLDGLVRDLRTIDGELEALATERKQHRLLKDACDALTELGTSGGAQLFWGEHALVGDDHIRRARSRADAFQKRVSEIEGRRQAVLDEINRQQLHADVLEDDLFEAQEEEERRKLEWIIEREIGELPARELIMPWTRRGEDDRRFRKSLAVSLLVCLLLAVIFPMIDLPLPEPQAQVDLPDRVVRMMMETRPLPPPPRQEPKPQAKEQMIAQKPVEKPVPQKQVKPDKEEAKPVEVPQPAPEKGLLAFREKLATFTQAQVTDRIGLKSRINDADESSAGRPERSMLTTNVAGSSGGINLASLSRNSGGGGNGAGGGMAGVAVERATSSIGGSGRGGGAAGRPLAGTDARASRTDEEIQIVFDRYKAALYRLYNRELRKDPSLRGQMVLRLTIEPDGRVSLCQLQSSDMNAPELSAQVVERVRAINFGAKDVDAITILYPIDFLPAA
jgi:hypothetical protein